MPSTHQKKPQSDDAEEPQCLLSSCLPDLLKFLTAEEELRIHQQFGSRTWKLNSQILWHGLLREEAQTWADRHDMQTLTSAMGPLLNPKDPLYALKDKGDLAMKKYMKGASAIFAWHISRGETVTVLTPPPPDCFHPSGITSFQLIEQPILKGAISGSAVRKIEMMHPTVKGAEDFKYQIWPTNETSTWMAKFGKSTCRKRCWRAVPTSPNYLALVLSVADIRAIHLQRETHLLNDKCGCEARGSSTETIEKKEKDTVEAVSMLKKSIKQVNSRKREKRRRKRERRRAKKQSMEQKELRKQKEMKRQNELQKPNELKKVKELKKEQELKKQKDLKKQKELRKQKELQKQKELKRQKELRKQKNLQNLQKQKELKEQKELQKPKQKQKQMQATTPDQDTTKKESKQKANYVQTRYELRSIFKKNQDPGKEKSV